MLYFIGNIDSFKCKLSKIEYKFLNSNCDYTIILSGDCFILFEHIDEKNAKIIFWCTFYAISDIQIIQSLKAATINFYENKQDKDFILKLYIENIVLFRDILITRMKSLNIKISLKIIDSNSEKNQKRRLTIKDMGKMNLADLEKTVAEMKQNIDKGEIDEYSINTFITLCGKTIEELNKSFEKTDEEKQEKYEKMIEDVYKLEKVDNFNNNEINENNELKINKAQEKNEDKSNIVSIEDKNEINNEINISDKNEIIINDNKEENKIKDVNEIKEN